MLSQEFQNNHDLSEILFQSVTNDELQMPSCQCRPSLRIIKANVGTSSLEAVRSICTAFPSPGSFILAIRSFAVDFECDAIIQTVVQRCPMIESISITRWALTDAGLDALANIHSLKQLRLYLHQCSTAFVERVFEANPALASLSIDKASIDDALVRCIGNNCGNLKRLELIRFDRSALGDNTLFHLFRGCPLLKSFC